MTGIVLGVAIVLLVMSAVLTTAATAVFQLNGSRVRTLQDEGFQGAGSLARLREKPRPTRTGLRILSRTLDILAVGLAVAYAQRSWGDGGVVSALLLGVPIVLFVGDVLPRALVARRPVRLALLSAPPLLSVSRWVNALGAPFARLEEALLRAADGEVSPDERELRDLQELGEKEGMIEDHESLLVERAFRLDDLTAWDVMTPRVDIFAWRDALTLQEIVGQLSEVPYSRVPVFGESVDDVTGILYVREAYEAYVDGNPDLTLKHLAREPFFVPGSLPLSGLLQAFQTKRIHMGIVADEFGGIDGLVTLEDVLEELVGDIVDETDVDEEELIQESENQALADAGVDIRDVNQALNVSLPYLEHRSLNGFILEELGYVPGVGESLERAGVRIEVVEATETQVLRARITRLPTPLPAEPTD
ncbi:MAG: CNNM domain-containing protein [Gemmatimonadetes bacterium]|nr:CNNM domain-containing protein [Gemmatimonadota bacterium]